MNDETIALQILERILGTSSPGSGGDRKFHCPSCRHQKKKFEINIPKGVANCWTCSLSGSIFKIVRIYGSKTDYDDFKKIYHITHENKKQYQNDKAEADSLVIEKKRIELPKGFETLANKNPLDKSSLYRQKIYRYLEKRSIDYSYMFKYNIGYVASGHYGDRIVIPSYDADGDLNYYSCRTVVGDTPKYLHPASSIVHKNDIIMFEQFIDWKKPIIITEGPIDAIKCWHQAIPIQGSSISIESKLFSKLMIHKPTIILALDNDDVGIQKMIDISRLLMEWEIHNLYKINIPKSKKDLGEMSTKEIIGLLPINKLQKIDEDYLLEMEIGTI